MVRLREISGLVLADSDLPHRGTIEGVAVLPVALSVILHGISAVLFSNWYAKRADEMGVCAGEKR
jgi:predicted Na+-dependent transporter